MALKIITADQRLATPQKVNIILLGPSGVGKTTQARTLDPNSTLFIDLEAGTLAIQDWKGDVIDVRSSALELGVHPWEFARALACLLCGPDPADPSGPYSQKAYDQYRGALGEPEELFGSKRKNGAYTQVFVDSITVASRLCFAWAQTQPEAFNQQGKPDTRGAYGLLGREMMRWLTTLQHIPGKSIIVVGILDKQTDDLKRVSWEPQIEGSKTGREMGGIFDQVITLQNFSTEDGRQYRAFVTNQDNAYGYPAKDRSGRLDALEEPNLGKLINKIRSGPRKDGKLQLEVPTVTTAEEAK